MESVAKQLIVQVEKVGLKFYDHEGNQLDIFADLKLIKPTTAKFSPSAGKHLAVLTFGGVTILNMDNNEVSGEVQQEDIAVIDFSPKGTYLIACSKYIEGQSNLFIINMKGEIVAQHIWKSGSKEGCENISWTNDELYMARREAMSAKSLHVYETKVSIQKEFDTITQDKITSFKFSPHGGDESKPYFLVVGSSGETCCLTKFYQMKTCDKEKFKNLSKGGQEITFVFAPNGHAVIVWCQYIVDKTGQSYYGNHDLRYVQLGGGNKRSKVAVFDSQVHDVAWSPDSEDFIVISGKQPAVCTIYSKNCVPTFEFGRMHVNTIRYNPFSNLVLLGGFGGLVGEMQFWDKDSLKLIGKNIAHCTIDCQWSPDGTQIMTAVLFPRVRVENEVKQFTYYGKKLQHRKINDDNELYASCWRPQPIEKYTKVEVPEGSLEYSVETDIDEINQKASTVSTKKKGTLVLPKSSAFSNMMRAEMNAATLQGPRKLKKDDYKEYMLETLEEKNALKAKPVAKKKTVQNSWRTKEGFKIPSKVDQEKQKSQEDEEVKLIPAPQEYKAPSAKPENSKEANQAAKPGAKKKKNKNKGKKTTPQPPGGSRGGHGGGYDNSHGGGYYQGGGQHYNDDYYNQEPNGFYDEYY